MIYGPALKNSSDCVSMPLGRHFSRLLREPSEPAEDRTSSGWFQRRTNFLKQCVGEEPPLTRRGATEIDGGLGCNAGGGGGLGHSGTLVLALARFIDHVRVTVILSAAPIVGS